MAKQKRVIHSDPDILGGTPVFVGTRVPLQNLTDYLEAGDSLDDFLESFPTVTRKQAVAALELAREAESEIMRRFTRFSRLPLDDEELVEATDKIFLELETRESQHG